MSISWTQSQLRAIYEAQNEEKFDKAFDAAFSPSYEIRANHKLSTLDDFRASVSRIRAEGRVEVPTPSQENTITASNSSDEVVAGMFKLIVHRSIPLKATQDETYMIHFSASVHADKGDGRRITSFYHTSVKTTPSSS
ncbi:hypothetical protein DFH29DRAFT_363789 [Suillus ampliporus]|nr:hypothetical protein DFH29DRAFT_363789 [Suillus ampliporus]